MVSKKSFQFAVQVIRLAKFLRNRDCEYAVVRQLERAGTSIGANVREAQGAETKKDFIHKMQVALKEAHETKYWLELLHDTNAIPDENYNSAFMNVHELTRLLGKIIVTSKAKMGSKS